MDFKFTFTLFDMIGEIYILGVSEDDYVASFY